MKEKRLVIVGGGPAGFFCGVNAARMSPRLRVTILEKSAEILSKLKMSGGGRCNITHGSLDITEMAERYPRGKNFVKKAFHRFFVPDLIRWFQERGIRIKQEPDGRMFPSTDSSRTIIDCLTNEASRYGVQVTTKAEVSGLQLSGGLWEVKSQTRRMEADFVCISCGGYPKAAMFSWLTDLGHTIETPVPSLFTFNIPGSGTASLMGIVVRDTTVKVIGSRMEERGPLLFTHWGMSGPVIINLSARAARELAAAKYEFGIRVNWVPALNEEELRALLQDQRAKASGRKLRNRNPFELPQRFWESMLMQSGIDPEVRWGDLPSREMSRLVGNLSSQEFKVKGKTRFKEEFVTAGGIKLGEVDVNTMMSKKRENLFFAGEVLDVDGVTGGYNLQHAWTSAFVAAADISRRSSGRLPLKRQD
ncbi:MAG: NAD(P)/FAD-dependent oxidoreductase [Desulfobacteraceae bacterium]|nr:MAG: NAD(P)/FAD-dependent oxidoreductase [Desulfobacteraceae bacterium]